MAGSHNKILDRLCSITVETDDALRLKILQQAGVFSRGERVSWMHPVSMNSINAKQLTPSTHGVTPKVDGVRQFLITNGNTAGIFFIGRDTKLMKLHHLQAVWYSHLSQSDPQREQLQRTLFSGAGMVLDGELVIDGSDRLLFLAHDVLKFSGQLVEHLSFGQRWSRVLTQLVNYPDKRQPASGHNLYIYAKEIYRLAGFEYLCSIRNSLWKDVELDGYIFIPLQLTYIKRSCSSMLKWKEKADNTVDAITLIQKLSTTLFRSQMLCKSGHNSYSLVKSQLIEVSTKRQRRKLKALRGRVCEFSLTEAGLWKYVRTRRDKLEPNYLSVCENILTSIQNYIDLHQLKAVIRNCCAVNQKQYIYNDTQTESFGHSWKKRTHPYS